MLTVNVLVEVRFYVRPNCCNRCLQEWKDSL